MVQGHGGIFWPGALSGLVRGLEGDELNNKRAFELPGFCADTFVDPCGNVERDVDRQTVVGYLERLHDDSEQTVKHVWDSVVHGRRFYRWRLGSMRGERNVPASIENKNYMQTVVKTYC